MDEYGSPPDIKSNFPYHTKNEYFGFYVSMPDQFNFFFDVLAQIHEGYRFGKVYFDDSHSIDQLKSFVEKFTPKDYTINDFYLKLNESVSTSDHYYSRVEYDATLSTGWNEESLDLSLHRPHADGHMYKALLLKIGLEEIINYTEDINKS